MYSSATATVRRCRITRPSRSLTRTSALSPYSAASSMLATRAVASSCFLTKSRIGPRPPRVAHPATAARSRYTPSHQAHAVQSRNKQQLNTQRETATVILASPASPADYLRFPVQTLKAGSIGTINALEVARNKQARFVLASSSEVYGDPLEHPQPESYWGNVNPIGPRSPYDEGKRFAEAIATAYSKTYSVSIAIARIFNSYGPRMRSR